MLKSLLLGACLLVCVAAAGQITLTDAYFPVAGDSLQYNVADTTTTVDLLTPGPNRQWDFGSPTVRSEGTLATMAVAAGDTLFTDADLTQELNDNTLGYFQVEDGEFRLVGLAGELDFLDSFPYEAPINPGRVDRRAPLSYNDAFTVNTVNRIEVDTDSIPEDALADFGPQLTTGVDSLRITTVSSRQDTVDAYGTLTIDGRSYEVLRERRDEVLESTIEVKSFLGWTDVTSIVRGQLPDFDLFFGDGTPTRTYYYWSNSEKEAIAIVIADEDDNPTDLTFIRADETNSLGGPRFGQARISLYPNPARDRATLELNGLERSGNYTLSITNVLGRRVNQQGFTATAGRAMVDIDVSRLPRGTYLYSVTTKEGRILTTRRLLVGK